MRTHLRTGTTQSDVACGRGGYYPVSVGDTTRVSCQRCQASSAFRTRQAVERIEASQQAAVEAQAAGADSAREAIKEALDAVFTSAHAVADDKGYCSTFDEILDEIEVPSWYTSPTRKMKYDMELAYVHREGIVAVDEDEAYRMIAENVREYIVLTEN